MRNKFACCGNNPVLAAVRTVIRGNGHLYSLLYSTQGMHQLLGLLATTVLGVRSLPALDRTRDLAVPYPGGEVNEKKTLKNSLTELLSSYINMK